MQGRQQQAAGCQQIKAMDAADKILQKALGEKESSQHCSSQCDRDARIRELTGAGDRVCVVDASV